MLVLSRYTFSVLPSPRIPPVSSRSCPIMPGAIKSGETYPEVLELVYNHGGKNIIATVKVNFIVDGSSEKMGYICIWNLK